MPYDSKGKKVRPMPKRGNRASTNKKKKKK